MLRVALTGGIGSGKSTAADMFRELGCFVSQSDEVARAMMQPGQPVYQSIVQTFGSSILLPGGDLNRAALANLAFAQNRAEDLNGIVHPAVIAYQDQWMRSVGEKNPEGVAMVESALVFETSHGSAFNAEQRDGERDSPSWHSRFDRILLVTAPESVRIHRSVERYLARANASSQVDRRTVEADMRARMQAQLPDERKAAMADVVLANDGSPSELRERVVQIWHTLRDEAARRAGANGSLQQEADRAPGASELQGLEEAGQA